MCGSTCTRYVLIETMLNRIKQLLMAFNAVAVKPPFPATLRHIAAVRGKVWTTKATLWRLSAVRRLTSALRIFRSQREGEQSCLVLPEAESAFSSGLSLNSF